MVKLGVVFPQTEIGDDPVAVRDFAQAAEGAGFDHLIAYDHVLGADASRFDGRPIAGFSRPPYTLEHQFHELFVLFGFLAAATSTLELASGILILPQRQTALVAKQAATIDVLSKGRLRLGVGVGWNFTEYEALGEDYHNRGRRMDEQIAVLRRLWTETSVTHAGEWHQLDQVGIRPLPIQRPIPIWIGASAEPALRRLARTADGWYPQFSAGDDRRATFERVRSFVREAGRDPDALQIEGRVGAAGDVDDWIAAAREWIDLGVTHLSIGTTNAGCVGPQQHIDAILKWYQEIAPTLD